MEVKVKDRQSMLDMAVQTAGSMEAAFGLAAANGVSLTDTLADGQVLDMVAVENADTVRQRSGHPARDGIERGRTGRARAGGHQLHGC